MECARLIKNKNRKQKHDNRGKISDTAPDGTDGRFGRKVETQQRQEITQLTMTEDVQLDFASPMPEE